MEHLYKARIAVVHNFTVTNIQSSNLCHVFLAELEIPNSKILLHALLMDGFRNHRYASLYIPAQSHLGSCLSIFLSNGSQYRMGKNVVPALSRSMQRLENEIQVPLFIRRKNKIELNENGKLAVEYAKKIMSQTNDMINGIRDYDRKQRTIFVGSCAPAPLWKIIPALSGPYPDMTISSEIRDSNMLLEELRQGRYQLIILPYPIEEKGISCIKYEEEHLFFSLPPAHPLSGSKTLQLKDLNGETMLLRSRLGFWEQVTNEKMPDTRFLVQEDSVFNELAKASALPSFNSNLAVQREGMVPNRILIPITDKEANVTYYCCYLSKTTLIEKLFHKNHEENGAADSLPAADKD